jgi:hypothetical protein
MSPKNSFKADRAFKKEIVAAKLGYKCNSPDCKWWDDGSQSWGCRNLNMLEIDHILGGGTEEKDCTNQDNWLRVYKLIETTNMDYIRKYYQLLCSNCNQDKVRIKNQFAKNTHPFITRQDLKDLGAMKRDPKKVAEELKNTAGLVGEAYKAAVKLGLIKEDEDDDI